MPRFPLLQASFVLLLLSVSSCQRRQVTVPVPPAPVTSQPAPPPTPAANSSGTPSSETGAQPETPSTYQVNKPAPAQAAKKPARPAASPAPAAASSGTTTPAAQAPAAAPTTPAPKLGDILTPDARKQYGASIDQSLSHAQASLNSIAGRQLNKDQQAQVDQIRNFMEQARTSRDSDAAGAKSLAERAEVLARDLAATFR